MDFLLGRFGCRFRGTVRKAVFSLFVMWPILLLPTLGAGDDEVGTYRVGPEDQINITVARHPEFSGTFYVPSDGMLNLPAIGQIVANGKTLKELSEEIAELLRNRLRSPEVTVNLQSPRMQRVYVLGAVRNPGLYDMKSSWRITEALAAAGGLALGVDEADCKAIVLRVRNNKRETFALTDVFRGESQANAKIESGDVLTIEAQETIPVYVVGKVKAPGLYKLRKDNPGVIQAITLAGGALDEAALDRVTISRLDGSSKAVNLLPAMFDGNQESNVLLQPGDLVTVPEETARIAVLGYVKEPGFYALKNGQKLTLSDALGLAKGTESNRADIGAIAVIRVENGQQQKTVYNMHRFLKSGDASHNPEIKPGDIIYVPKSGRPDWDFLVRSLTAIGILINPFVP